MKFSGRHTGRAKAKGKLLKIFIEMNLKFINKDANKAVWPSASSGGIELLVCRGILPSPDLFKSLFSATFLFCAIFLSAVSALSLSILARSK